MTKLYRFEQTLDGYIDPHFQMTGTLEEVMYRWFNNPAYMSVGVYIDSLKDTYTTERNKIKNALEKQKVYVEIVDADLYSLGWVTKIEEVEE